MTHTDHISDDEIEQALDKHDDRDHSDALSVDDARALLAHVQMDAEAAWGEWLDNIERDDVRVIAETGAVIVLDTGEYDQTREMLSTYDGPVHVDDVAEQVVSAVHHALAREAAPEYNWGYSYPVVIAKPERFDAGQAYVEAVINGLCRRGCSPGQAWAYYAVEIQGESQSGWARRMGYSGHSPVAKALKKARETLQG